jgi:hypothetical protein
MYCSTCGGAVAHSLSYCNHCGAKLGGDKDKGVAQPAELFPDSLIWAIVSVFVVGLGATIGLMAVMKEVAHFNPGLIIAFTLLSFLLTIAVEGVLIWLLLSRRGKAQKVDDKAGLKEQTTKELGAAQARALAEPLPSVTENTTRAFEPIYSERESK